MPFSLIGSLISSGLNMIDSHMARDANRDNMLLQSSLNRNQYLFERELESPEKQRELYEKAGLNPALLYGGAGSSIANGAGISGTTATATAPTNPVRITAPSMLELAQVRNLDEKTKGDQIDNLTRANKNYLDLVNKRTEIEERLAKTDLSKAQIDNAKKELVEINARIDLLNAKTKTEGTKQDLNVAQTATEETEQEKNRAHSNLYGEQSKSEVDRRYNLREQAKLYNSMADKEDEMVEYLKAATAHKKALTDSEKQELKRKIAQTVDIYARLGIDGAKVINDIIATWVPSPGKLMSEVLEMFESSTATGKKVTTTKKFVK